MQLLFHRPVTSLHADQYHQRELPTRTPHLIDLTYNLNISEISSAHPDGLIPSSNPKQIRTTFYHGGPDEIHGTFNARSETSTERVKTPDMTLDASLPPSAPMTVTATQEDIQHPHVNGQDVRNGYGEVHASLNQMPLSQPTLRETCADIHKRVSRFLAVETQDDSIQQTQEQSRIALGVIQEALQRYDFDTLSLSYNGGKDCLVLLILYLAALHTHFIGKTTTQSNGNVASFPSRIPSIYAKPPDPFPEVTSFVETSTQAYHLSLTHISTNPGSKAKYKSHSSPPPTPVVSDGMQPIVTFRDAFSLYLEANPGIQAIFVGTRRTDPHGGQLTHFDMTDGNWPRFMRIHPVIDWQLSDVWTFLRHPALADLQTGQPLHYCSIYDKGYTSLGGVGDTLRNPKLRYHDEMGHESYRPAYQMTEDRGERLGRE